MKKCSICKETKELSEFWIRTWKTKNGEKKEGLRADCKSCAGSNHKKNYTAQLQNGDPWKLAGELLNRMRDRTKKHGYSEPVDFTKEEVVEIITNGKCAITGFPFRLGTTGTNKEKNPFNPSPDRIDNSKGYSKDNVQWVVFIYNTMRNSFDDKDVLLFINHLKESYDMSSKPQNNDTKKEYVDVDNIKPVAWMTDDGKIVSNREKEKYDITFGDYCIPLYTAPRELSDDEIINLYAQIDGGGILAFARAIEERHGIK
jgi:hypothetical protein